MSHRRVLFACADTGFGHRAAANAVAAATRELLGAEVETEVVDAYDEARVPVLASTPSLYAAVTRHNRRLFDAIFAATDQAAAQPLLVPGLRRLAQARVEALLAVHRPDTVVVCNPMHMGELFARVRRDGGHRFALATVITDPVRVHRSWFADGVDVHFLVGARPVEAWAYACRAVPFPVHPGFARPEPDRADARRRLGLDPCRPVALISGGGAGAGSRATWRRLLTALAGDGGVQLLVAAGTNRDLLGLLRQSEFAQVRVLAPTGSLEVPLRASSVMFSKAGPASIFEAAALGVPLRLFDEVGPQERGNIAYARSLGIAEALDGQDPVALVHEAEGWPRRPRPELTGGAAAVARWIASV